MITQIFLFDSSNLCSGSFCKSCFNKIIDYVLILLINIYTDLGLTVSKVKFISKFSFPLCDETFSSSRFTANFYEIPFWALLGDYIHCSEMTLQRHICKTWLSYPAIESITTYYQAKLSLSGSNISYLQLPDFFRI